MSCFNQNIFKAQSNAKVSATVTFIFKSILFNFKKLLRGTPVILSFKCFQNFRTMLKMITSKHQNFFKKTMKIHKMNLVTIMKTQINKEKNKPMNLSLKKVKRFSVMILLVALNHLTRRKRHSHCRSIRVFHHFQGLSLKKKQQKL